MNTETRHGGSDPKEQHFVPQFYLRAFSQNKKQVRLYNFAGARYVPSAPIRNQCARSKFHAFAPGLEQELAQMEGAWAQAIRSILDRGAPPERFKDEWDFLIEFVVYQRARTTRAADGVNDLADNLIKAQLRDHPAFKDADFDKMKVVNKHAVAFTLRLVHLFCAYAQDLGMHLFLNESPTEFLTSDDPVVAHNQYCEGISQGCLGWNCAGLQLFLPLSPSTTLLLYDTSVYKVEGSRSGRLATVLTASSHVEQINSLQALNAKENVYFMSEPSQSLTQFMATMGPKRPKRRAVREESAPSLLPSGDIRKTIHNYEAMLPVRLALPQISIRRRARRVPLPQRANLFRHRSKEEAWGYRKPGWLPPEI
jgi:hypothetical protein